MTSYSWFPLTLKTTSKTINITNTTLGFNKKEKDIKRKENPITCEFGVLVMLYGKQGIQSNKIVIEMKVYQYMKVGRIPRFIAVIVIYVLLNVSVCSIENLSCAIHM